MYDMLGKLITTATLNNYVPGSLQFFDIQHFSAGAYYLKFYFEDGVIVKQFEKY